jgi:hypothetical protein
MAKKINLSYVTAIVVLAVAVMIGVGGALTGGVVREHTSSDSDCYDNDAAGIGDITFRGTVTLQKVGRTLTFEDKCAKDNLHLIQHYCSNDGERAPTTSYLCDDGCKVGFGVCN